MKISLHPNSIRRVASAAFGLAAVALLACAIFWPAWAESVLHSRLTVALSAAWCVVVGFLLHPELGTGLAQAIREFRKAARDMQDDIDR